MTIYNDRDSTDLIMCFVKLISRGKLLDRIARILIWVLNRTFHNFLRALWHATQILQYLLLVKSHKFRIWTIKTTKILLKSLALNKLIKTTKIKHEQVKDLPKAVNSSWYHGIFIMLRGSMTRMICHLTAMYGVTINLYAYLTPFTIKNQHFAHFTAYFTFLQSVK